MEGKKGQKRVLLISVLIYSTTHIGQSLGTDFALVRCKLHVVHFSFFFFPLWPHSVRSELTQPCALMFQLTAINPGLVQGRRRKEIMETQQCSSLCFSCCFCLLRDAFTAGWQLSAVSWLGGTAHPRYGLADAGSVLEKGWCASGTQYSKIK